MGLTYSEYLQLDRILAAQNPRSPGEHDEMLFIVVHQTYELWFKQLLHEGDHLRALFADGQDFRALATLQRMLVILKTLVKQTDVLETMTPLSFASFRSKLERSSGFQSLQFRQLEFFLGFKSEAKLQSLGESSPAYQALAEYFYGPSLYDSFLCFIDSLGDYELPAEVVKRDFRVSREGSDERVEKVLLAIYHHNPKLSLLCEKLVDFDEGIQEWRYRHVKMVERTIGQKIGTGGSLGVEYLKKSLFRPAFPELWAVRSQF